ncbi:MAG: SPOR domain-containing protein [Bacteroidota bacterium]|nr:MAG: SPOR domain-containing protein [Bacteroidota bacterium]
MFSRAFPSVASYLSYNVPSYKIKVGNFEDRKEASAFLRKVNKAFPAAFIVPDVVTIKNINVIK